jgi:DNA-binding NarL/FixJ family response regulator
VRATAPPLPEARVYRVVVAQSTYLLREGLRHALEGEDEVVVEQYCSDLPSLLAAVEEHEPDVVITGIRMPPTNTDEGIQAAEALYATHPEVGIVVICEHVTPQYALRFFKHGSAGRAYLLREHVGHRIQVMAAIREAASGGSVIDPEVLDLLVESRTRARNSRLARLTPREREVLAGIAEGLSNASVAQSLFLTKRAVEKNINSIFTKLDLHDDVSVSRRVAASLLYLNETAAPDVCDDDA